MAFLKHLIICVTVWSWGLFPNISHGATYTVSNGNDAGAGSFRQAILDMNTAIRAGTDTTPTINFSGTYSITLASVLPLLNERPFNLTGGDAASGGDLTVVDGVTI